MSPSNQSCVFHRHRCPPVPATARGTCRRRGCQRHPTLGNSTTAGPIAFKFGVCLETSYFYTSLRWCASARAHVHTPFADLANGWADCVQIWFVARDPLDKGFAQVRGDVHLHVRTCRCLSHDGASSPARLSPITAPYWYSANSSKNTYCRACRLNHISWITMKWVGKSNVRERQYKQCSYSNIAVLRSYIGTTIFRLLLCFTKLAIHSKKV